MFNLHLPFIFFNTENLLYLKYMHMHALIFFFSICQFYTPLPPPKFQKTKWLTSCHYTVPYLPLTLTISFQLNMIYFDGTDFCVHRVVLVSVMCQGATWMVYLPVASPERSTFPMRSKSLTLTMTTTCFLLMEKL